MQQAGSGTPCAAQAVSRARPCAASAADGASRPQRLRMTHDACMNMQPGRLTQVPCSPERIGVARQGAAGGPGHVRGERIGAAGAPGRAWNAVRRYCVRIMGRSCLLSICCCTSVNSLLNLATSPSVLPCAPRRAPLRRRRRGRGSAAPPARARRRPPPRRRVRARRRRARPRSVRACGEPGGGQFGCPTHARGCLAWRAAPACKYEVGDAPGAARGGVGGAPWRAGPPAPARSCTRPPGRAPCGPPAA